MSTQDNPNADRRPQAVCRRAHGRYRSIDQARAASRRAFLKKSAGLVGLGTTVPSFLAGTAQWLFGETCHAFASRRSGSDGRILVVIQLAGGNDGLNMIVPYRNDEYYRLRPTLAIPRTDVIKIDEHQGWHSEATAYQSLLDAGTLGIVQSVGYPNPNRSHFVSTRIWETASPKGRFSNGWVGRYFDSTCGGGTAEGRRAAGQAACDRPDPRLGIAVANEVPLAMQGDRFAPVTTPNPAQFGGPPSRRRKKQANNARFEGMAPVHGPVAPGAAGNLDFLRRSYLEAMDTAVEIRAAARMEIAGAQFPNGGFGQRLKHIARMIVAGMGTRIYYTSISGFDTHANQLPRQARLIRESGRSLRAFVDALARTSHLDQTLVLVFSEFGRRVAENASGGTDHGQAAPMFLLGGKVKGGVHGPLPHLDRLTDGDLAFGIDFRTVYATVLRDWLAVDPNPILGGKWASLPLLKT
ncbi:MAG: DUF1501 domain-containing protein [Phycisphaerae bacterium]